MAKKVMLIGAGGVAGVAAAKMAQNPDVFGELLIASRTKARCDAIKADVEKRPWFAAKGVTTKISTAQIDAMDVPRLTALIKEFKPDLVMNIALPYQDLAIMDACLAAGVSYLDTANYEPPEEAHFEYSWQWAYRERFEKAGLTAILGCGFDPGVTQVFSAYAQKHYLTATAATTAIPSPPTSTPRSTSARSPRRALTGSTTVSPNCHPTSTSSTSMASRSSTGRRLTRAGGSRPRRWP